MSGRPGLTPAPTPARFVTRELLRRPRALAALAGWSVLETLPALLSGQFIARAVDQGFVAGRLGTGLAWLVALAVAYLAAAVGTRRAFGPLATLVEAIRDELVHRVVAGTLHHAVAGVVTAGTPAGPHAPGAAAVARLTNQVETVRDVTAGLLLIARRFVFTLAGAVLGLLTLAPVLLLIAGPPVVVALVLFVFLMRVLVPRQRAVILAEEEFAHSTGPVIDGMRDVTAFGAQAAMAAQIGRHVDAHAAAARALARSGSLRTLVVAVGAYLPVVLVLAATPWLVRRGLTIGVLLGGVTYLAVNLESALRALVQSVGSSGLRLAVVLRRLLDMSQPAPSAHGEGAGRPLGHTIVLDRVTFRYGAHADPVLTGVTLTVPEGDHLAVVGPSGIGKSTLAGLITGRLTAESGRLRIGGAAPADIAGADLRRTVTLIPQEAYVFAGSARENLIYLNPAATDDDLDAAVTALHARPLLERIGGLAAQVRPADLSAGERQLLSLVRAYLADAPVTILDEATCHLDPVTEARVEHAFAERPGTLIVIAHRMSSAARARRILVLDGDRPACGSHDELLVASPLYADLMGHWAG